MFEDGKRFYTSSVFTLTKRAHAPMRVAFLVAIGACSSNSETPANSSTEGDLTDTMTESEDSKGDEESQSPSDSSTAQDSTQTSGESGSQSDEESQSEGETASINDDSGSDDAEESSDSDGLLPNGEKCNAPEECQSGLCPTASSGDGVCSKCAMNQDCMDAGTGSICVEKASLGYFTCLSGELGEPCAEESECKEDLVCSQIPLEDFRCSECAKDEDCGDGRLCWVRVPEQSGDPVYNHCLEEGSLEIGKLCGLEIHGDRACKDGFCEIITGQPGTSPPLGVCSECRAKGDDCEADEMCIAAHVDSATVSAVPSECVGEDEDTTGDSTTGTDTGTTGTDSDMGTTTTGTDETGTDTDVF